MSGACARLPCGSLPEPAPNPWPSAGPSLNRGPRQDHPSRAMQQGPGARLRKIPAPSAPAAGRARRPRFAARAKRNRAAEKPKMPPSLPPPRGPRPWRHRRPHILPGPWPPGRRRGPAPELPVSAVRPRWLAAMAAVVWRPRRRSGPRCCCRKPKIQREQCVCPTLSLTPSPTSLWRRFGSRSRRACRPANLPTMVGGRACRRCPRLPNPSAPPPRPARTESLGCPPITPLTAERHPAHRSRRRPGGRGLREPGGPLAGAPPRRAAPLGSRAPISVGYGAGARSAPAEGSCALLGEGRGIAGETSSRRARLLGICAPVGCIRFESERPGASYSRNAPRHIPCISDLKIARPPAPAMLDAASGPPRSRPSSASKSNRRQPRRADRCFKPSAKLRQPAAADIGPDLI